MYRLRPASFPELPIIHRLQDTPYREKVFASPLPPLEEFLALNKARMDAGDQFYYLFEQNSAPLGYVEFRKEQQTTSIWGKWLSTLVYGCMVLAFDDLKFSRLVWCARAINKPMIRTCEKMRFRKTGEKEICNITQGFAFIAIGKIIFYEFTADEFNANRRRMRALSLPLEFLFRRSIDGKQQPESPCP